MESVGLAGLFERIFNRLDTRYKPEIIDSENPKTGEKQIGYFKPDGSYQGLWTGEATPRFPAVTVYDTESLAGYLERYGSRAIDGQRSILYVNQGGLFGVIDYGIEGSSEHRRHQVKFPAAWDEACRPAAELITKSVGRWIGFEQFVELLDKCAPALANFGALESATSSIEGHESAKISRTARSYQVQVTGEVACAVEIPKVVALQLIFMGQLVTADLPLRLTVKDKQVQFYLIDDGAITAAKSRILTAIKRQMAERFEGLLVIEGSI